ncbi:MAG: glycoside hydrolase family 105 protein [Mangrovibacterium sp.]
MRKQNEKLFLLFFVLVSALTYGQSDKEVEDYDLKHWPNGKSPQEIGIRITKKFLEPPLPYYKESAGKIPYKTVCTWLGGLWFAEASKDKNLFNRLENNFTPLFEEKKHLQPIPTHVDYNVFGTVPFELYIRTRQQKYLDLGLKYADTQWMVPQDANPKKKAFADQGYSWQTRLWVDDMFMITALQVQAYRATGDKKYIDRAAREMVLYLDKLQLENGLFYHHPETPFSWGRGNGWFAVGMAEILRSLPKNNPDRERIMSSYLKMMEALLKYQEPDGMWRQIIDDRESWKETSCTAMFTYAFITGVKNGWLDKKTYGIAARKGWLGVISYINENNELTEVCQGTSRGDRDHYMNRRRITGDLHGHAPVLWCAAALLR